MSVNVVFAPPKTIPPTLVSTVVPFCVRFNTLPVPWPNFSGALRKFQVTLPCTVTVLFDDPAPIAKPALQILELVTASEFNPPPAPPTVIRPAFVTVAPVRVKRLLTEFAAFPTFTAPASRFQVTLFNTVTVLFVAPLPTVRAPLQSCALVTVMLLKRLLAAPTVIAPLETVTALTPPPTRYWLLLERLPFPMLMAPL